MTTVAKGSFPGRPRKKLLKQTVKFKKKLKKFNLNELKLDWCTNSGTDDSNLMFIEESDQDVEFLGFSSEECGLQAYKRVSKSLNSSSVTSNDILGSGKAHDHVRDKVVTRRSFALDSLSDAPHVQSTKRSSVKGDPESSTAKQDLSVSRDSHKLPDNAFMKYQNYKLDFHRLSKKAKNKKDSYEDFTTEERKDTSTLSLKYAAEIYEKAKNCGSSLIQAKSPIKPATFIPPLNLTPPHPPMNLTPHHQLPSVDTDSASSEFDLKQKTSSHSRSLTKSHFDNVCSSRKTSVGSAPPTAATVKSQKGFNLPLKSARSSRIIKPNRKYSDSTFTRNLGKSDVSKCANSQNANPADNSFHPSSRSTPVTHRVKPRRGRKPLLKQPTFVPDEAPSERLNDAPPDAEHSSSSDRFSSPRTRRLIKKARFKHPTSSDALVLGSECTIDDSPPSICRNPIRKATFTAPTLKNIARETLDRNSNTGLSDLGLSPSLWSRLSRPHKKTWVVGDKERDVPPWTRQEIHNVLHGANTFGPGWSSIARKYDFHELHRTWLGVCRKGKKCCQIGLLSSHYKVNSSILLQLKPKFSENPNMTVFGPNELSVRGLTSNVPCDTNSSEKRSDQPMRRRARLKVNKDVAVNLSINNRIFGTQLSEEFKFRKVKFREISKEDLYLGLSPSGWFRMLKARSSSNFKKTAWSPWEIHNILHGIHYFGVGSWRRICSMYRFMEGRDNLAIRGRFKSVCCRGLIVAGDVRPDIFPRLHVVLSREGKKYFKRNKISVTLCSLSERHHEADVKQLSSDLIAEEINNKKAIKEEGGVSISPPRRAVHLFGNPPLWDDLSPQAELLKPNDEEMPVIDVLESSLRHNVKSQRRSSADDIIATSTSCAVPPTTHRTPPVVKRTRSKSESKSNPSPVKSKSRGPRIKHVCRRASLVTGQTIATMEDHHPHLTALPLKERQKIMAHPERFKDVDSCSENENSHSKVVVGSTKKRTRKRTLPRRCGSCSTCVADPCLNCEWCRQPSDTSTNQPGKTVPCKFRKPCLQVNETELSKKSRRSTVVHSTGSRKSSRLQQQLVPLVAPLVTEPQTFSLSTVEAPPYHSVTTITDDVPSSPDSFFSPSDRNFFDRLNQQRQSLMKINHWKGTYDLGLLWKSGGHPVITSSPALPPISCLLCGSSGHPKESTDRLVHCSSCCEPFHIFCADPDHEHPVVKKRVKEGTWLCIRCKHCLVCGATGKLLECRRCLKGYHTDCLGPTYPTKQTSNKFWVCMQCISCGSCGTVKPGHLPTSKWTRDYSMCRKCGDLYDKGNYCPICQKCYSDEDYDCRMVQCAKCKRWIHSRCENLTAEMYTVLSHMPDSVQYKCPMCDGRASKLQETSHVVDLPSTTSTFQLDKLRNFLSKLPPPLWKKLIEQEVQSGLEAVTMSLFHNKAAFSVLKRNEPISDDDSSAQSAVAKPRDLFAIRFAVHNRRYQSIGQFHSDVMHVIGSVTESNEKEALENVFREEGGRVFTWFNFQTGKIKDDQDLSEDFFPHLSVATPYNDHSYTHPIDKDLVTSTYVKSSNSSVNEIMNRYEDMRQCIFCNHRGDDKALGCGRLLYCGQDDWCHVNCALWSAEVYEQHDGSLGKVHSAASRGKMMKCDYCKLPGATVGCNTRGCPKNYHFACAKLSHCFFQRDKKVFCKRHGNVAKQNATDDELFNVDRLVCVDNDEMRPNRRWQRGIPSSDVTLLIGSLTVKQIGYLTLSSDSKDYLQPISFQITRVFWSAFNADRKTVYTITIRENTDSSGSKPAPPAKETTNNHTISHSVAESLKSHQDASASPYPILSSPPRIQRTNLPDKMDLDSHIGPLSPTRRISGAPHSKRPQYTIIANSNKTLPQVATPHPSAMFTLSSPSSRDVSPTSTKYKSAIKVSPANPFLNLLTSNVSKRSSPVATSTDSRCEVVPEDSSFSKDQNFLPHATSFLQPTRFALPDRDSCVANDQSSFDFKGSSSSLGLSAPSTPRKKGLKIIRRNTPEKSTPNIDEQPVKPPPSPSPGNSQDSKNGTSPGIEPGSTGLLLQSSIQPPSASATFSEEPLNLPLKATSSVLTKSEPQSIAPPPCDAAQCSGNSIRACSVVLKRQQSDEILDPSPSSVISLTCQARSAAQTEKHSPAFVDPPVTPSSRRIGTPSNALLVACSEMLSSTQEVVREQSSSQANILKKDDKTPVRSSPMPTRESRRRKSANINYSEAKVDELFEDALRESAEKEKKLQAVNDQKEKNLDCEKESRQVRDNETEIRSNVGTEFDTDSCFRKPSAPDFQISSTLTLSDDCNVDHNKVHTQHVDDVMDKPPSDVTSNVIMTSEKNSPTGRFDVDTQKTDANIKIISSCDRTDVDIASSRDFVSSYNSPLTTSNDERRESTFPSKQLRKFALDPTSPTSPPKRLTRSRSKSSEPRALSNTSEGPDVKPRARHTSDDKKSPKTSEQSRANEPTDARRYPRRNTYTCLKSFSGLSTNYALASYSRDRDLSSFSDKKSKANAAKKKSHKSSVSFKKPDSESSTNLPQSLTPPEVARNDSAPPHKERGSIGDGRCLSVSLHKLDMTPLQSSQIEFQKTRNHTLNAPPESSKTSVPDQFDVDSESDGEVLSALVNSGDTVRELLDDVLNSLDYKEPMNEDQEDEHFDASKSLSSSVDSIEFLRGGGEDENPLLMSLLDGSGLVTPLEQSSTEPLSDSVDFMSSPEKPLVAGDDKEIVLDQPSSVSIFDKVDCPVLSADDVNTVLDGSAAFTSISVAPPLNPIRAAPSLSSSRFCPMPSIPSTVSPNQPQYILQSMGASSNPLNAQKAPSVKLFPPPTFEKPVLKNTSNIMSRHPQSSRFLAGPRPSVMAQKINCVQPPSHPVIIGGPVQAQVVSPVHCVPICVGPQPIQVHPQPVMCGKYLDSPLAPPQPNVLTVPYSVRVTMTMTPAVQTETYVDPNYSSNPQSVFRHSPPQVPPTLLRNHYKNPSTPKNGPKTNPNTACLQKLPATASQPTTPTSVPGSNASFPVPLIPIPPSLLPKSGSLNPLEHLIEFYSAKNKLSPQEKAIVRSIISRQLNGNQASEQPEVKAAPTAATSLPTRNIPDEGSNSRSKRRQSSDPPQPAPPFKAKRKRKEKFSLKVDFDQTSSDPPVMTEHSSPLCDVYRRRFSLEQTDKPFNKFLSSLNIFLDDVSTSDKSIKPPSSPGSEPTRRLVFEIKSDDGYHAEGPDLQDLIDSLLSSVRKCRFTQRSAYLPSTLHAVMTPYAFLGLSHDAVRFLVEQLPGATHCPCYKAKYHKKIKEEISHINPHGCCRAEQYKGRSKPDMFSFLASKHRPLPEYQHDRSQSGDEMMQLSIRRPTSMDSLPMAMRFRHLRTFSKQAVGVYRSSIHGRGLFCKRDIDASEMIMEYTGQVVRCELTDKREHYYESKGIGCYMFRMDDQFVVDATMMGSAARFINHSCDPNCYSKIVHIEGKKHILIFALKKIYRGEELTYDYKFPIEDEAHKIACNCGSRLCRKHMN